MPRILLSLFALIFLFQFQVFAQSDCGGGRYLTEIFSSYDLTSDVTYGSAYNTIQGNTQSLEMDIYEPTGDTEPLRPLIILEHGGTFLFGDKTGADVVALAEPLAKMGYVVASIEYRLGMAGFPFPGPDSADASEAVWRAVADMKAAVRWFHMDAAGSNTYRIDTSRLYIGGVSAGAIAATHYAYLDDINEMPAYIDTSQAGMGGGIEGNSGNAGYSSDVDGVINVSGMIGDTAWIKPGDEPIVSLHGTNDQTVPYGTAMITVMGSWPIFVVDGSSSIHMKMDQLGIDNCLYTHPGADHTPHVTSSAYLDTTLVVIKNFMHGLVCGVTPSCGYIVNTDEPLSQTTIEVWPNPSAGQLNLRVPADWIGDWEYRLTDLTGREVMTEKVSDATELRIRTNVPHGIYLLEARSEFGRAAKRVIIE